MADLAPAIQELPAPDSGHGFVVEHPRAKLTRLGGEHGQVDVSRCERRQKAGERVTADALGRPS